jgi:hypothetical protein
MPDAIITSTASTFGTISGTFAADQSTITGTVSGIVPGTLSGSVGVPGPAGSPGAPGPGVPAGGTAGQYLQKIDGTNYNTDWVTLNLSAYLTDAPSDGNQYARQSGAWSVVSAGSSYITSVSSPMSVSSGDLTIDLTLYATESWVTSGFYSSTNPSGFITSSALIPYAPLTGGTFSGPVITVAATTAFAGLRIPHGTAPTTGIANGDIWTTTAGIFARINGATQQYAPLASPAFTGNPTAPTAALADNDTSIATTAFVQQELLSGTANARNLEVYVRNQTGSTIPAGAIVYINGATGNRPTITLAQANNDANSAQTFGFTKTSIANNGFGFVIVRGECENLDTSSLTEGVQLYLSPTVAGAYTTTKPAAPQHLVYVGIVVRAHPTQGVILVAVQNGYELEELHDVSITSVANNNLLAYESSTDLWKNKTFSALGLLTSADAASTYAPLASPTFTGTPSLPTGTTAVTQTAGNNTTALATTAFVTAAVPAFATTEQAALNTSATTLISPANYRVAGLNTNLFAGTVSGLSSVVLGAGANIGSGYTILNGRLLAPNALTAGYASRGFTLSTPSNAATAGVNFGTASGHAVRVYSANWGSTVTGVKMRGIFGRRGGGMPAPAPLAERGYGWEWDFSTRTMRILAHNGTTLTNPSVTWNPIISRNYEIMVTSNGSGTISLYIDSVLMGTTTGGPNDMVGNSAPVWWQLELQNEVTASGQTDLLFQNPKVYTTNG